MSDVLNEHDFVLDENDFIRYSFMDQAEKYGPEKAPVQLVRYFTDEQHREFMRIMKRADKAKGDALVSIQIEMLELGWAGWEKVLRPGTEDEVEFDYTDEKKTKPSKKQINRLKISQRTELCYVIGEQKPELTPEQRKNLLSPSQQDEEEA